MKFLGGFYTDPGKTNFSNSEESTSAIGWQPNEMITVELAGKPGEILIQAYPNNGTCSKGERLLISI